MMMFSFVDVSFEPLDMRVSFGISLEAMKLERGHGVAFSRRQTNRLKGNQGMCLVELWWGSGRRG